MTPDLEEAREFLKSVLRVKHITRQFILKAIREQDIDITYEMLEVLHYLWNKNAVNQQEIADATLKDKASLTYLIDHLTKRQLVTRQQDDKDRRNKIILLTAKGNELRNIFIPIFRELYDNMQREIPRDILVSSTELLDGIYDRLTLACEA